MTYNEFISQFDRCSFKDKSVDTKGKYRHHIEPRAVQRKLYGKVVNDECVIVSFADHVRCHYYYWIEHQDDIDEGHALSLLLQLSKEELSALSEEEMMNITESLRGYDWWDEENRRKHSEKIKGTHPSEDTKRKISISNTGKHRTEETRKRMSESRKGTCLSEETKKKISESLTGGHLSDDTKKKLSEAHKGKKPTEETRRRMSEAQKGEKNHNYGKKLSEEERKRMSEARKGEKAYWYGKNLSDETKNKISNSLKGNKDSLDTRIKKAMSHNGKSFVLKKDNVERTFRCLSECVDWFHENGYQKVRKSTIHQVLKGSRGKLYGYSLFYLEDN